MLDLNSENYLIDQLGTLAGGPKVLGITIESQVTNIQLDVADGLSWFRGHFPGQPVLPGIVQVHWAVQACQILYGFTRPPMEIRRLKFKRVITPPRPVNLRLIRQDGYGVQFVFASRNDEHSEGKLIFSGGIP